STASGKEGRQVEGVRAEPFDVVEALLNAPQVATEPLSARLLTTALRQGVPRPRDRPFRQGPATRTGARKAVEEDLVDDRAGGPRGGAGVERQNEVVFVADVGTHDTEPVQPRIASLSVVEQPAVRSSLRDDGKARAKPRFVAARLVRLCERHEWL